MIELFKEADSINFGELPEAIDSLLQQGVVAYRHDRSRADSLFRQALAAAPKALPIYFCLYKIHTYQGHLDQAQNAAENRRDGRSTGGNGGRRPCCPTAPAASRSTR